MPRIKKAQSMKDAWIEETQMFQRIAKGEDGADSYESLSKVYDDGLVKKKGKTSG